MNLRTTVLILAIVLLGVFTLLNWTAFNTPTTLSIGFTEVQAPLGLVMLMVTALLCVLFLGYIVFQQAGLIRESRRTAKELSSQRALADSAEASRFTELRNFVAQENAALAARIEETERSLSSFLGEMDDKIDRLQPPPQG